jgi:hypothetical protein
MTKITQVISATLPVKKLRNPLSEAKVSPTNPPKMRATMKARIAMAI